MRAIDLEKIQAASSEVARDINRRIVLNLIRKRQPLSRADLARFSGLQRSTISLIVDELIEENWVLKGPTGRLPRGRRPTFLRLNQERVIIGVDIRPTQTTVALADVNGRFSFQEAAPTPAEPEEAMDALIQRIQRVVGLCQGKKIEGVGISVAGRFDREADRLAFAPNLKWRDVDIRNPIARATGLEVEIENAANACVLAAVWFDHMESCRNLAAVAVAEGIGTGLLINGRLARGLGGMAGEFGHVPLDPEGPLCGCGSRGCWEVFASNRAALRYYLETSSDGAGLSFPDLLSLADQGDARAARSLEAMAHYLGRGMRMITAGLAPERIIVIGDLTRSWHRFGPVIEAEMRAQALPGSGAPSLMPAGQDGMARLRGTIALVLQKDFAAAPEVPA
jgi:predicted NBD/HSP70 family sugar kinase/DNA-binding XRE family transcriptional regulator